MVFFGCKSVSNVRLDGKTAVITGCNTGIGKETARDFYSRGARVIMACRNVQSAQRAAEDIEHKPTSSEDVRTGQLRVVQLDLSDLKSVKRCAEDLLKTEDKMNLLINNAGVMMCPLTRTVDGHELQLASNHLGHFLLTLLLLPKIVESAPSRIVNVSSRLHRNGKIDFDDVNWTSRAYSAVGAYGQSKLANVLFTKELARRLSQRGVENVNVYSLHPGVIASDLSRHFDSQFFFGLRRVYDLGVRLFGKTVEQGALTTIYCAVDERCAGQTGLYYDDCEVKEPSDRAKNVEDGEKLWELSLELVGLGKEFDPFGVEGKM